MLLPRQQETPALYGSTALSSAPSVTPTSAAASNSSDNSNDTRNALWKYAIVVILAILALSTVFRLLFLRRARRLHRMQLENNLGVRNQGYRTNRGGEDRRRFSTDSADLQERGVDGANYSVEPPPPAYEEGGRPATTDFPPPPTPLPQEPSSSLSQPSNPQRPTSFLSRFSSRFKRSDSSLSTSPPPPPPPPPPQPSTNLPMPQPPMTNAEYFALSLSRQTNSPQTTARVLAEENESNRLRGDSVIRRVLSDAGILSPILGGPSGGSGGGRNRATSRASATPSAIELAQREREERRRARRERRRERRRRERERDEGLGLPVYSKKKAEGEEVLEIAEGVKEDETDTEEEEEDSETENVVPSSSRSPDRVVTDSTDPAQPQPTTESSTRTEAEETRNDNDPRSHPLA